MRISSLLLLPCFASLSLVHAPAARTEQRSPAISKFGTHAGPRQSALSDQTAAEIQLLNDRRFEYQGCHIAPAHDAPESQRPLQDEITAAFARDDSAPPERLELFEWCLANPRLKCTGWYGIIKDVSRSADTWRVTVQVSPRLAGLANVTFTPDYAIETWYYAVGDLRFAGAARAPRPVQHLFGD